jgi:6-phosphogluconolactonase
LSLSHPDVTVAPAATLAAAFAERCAARAAHCIAERGAFLLALTGGSVAPAFLPVLGDAAIDWERVDLLWGDERGLPPSDRQSNFGRARSLLAGTRADHRMRVHRIEGEALDLDAAAARYALLLERLAGRPPVIDLVLLGVGEDGHVCSLFPEHAATGERARWVVAVHDAPKPPARRVTLTMPVLEAARAICVAALGAEKAAVMRAALEDSASMTPIARLLRVVREPWILLDHAAAGALRAP